MTVSVSGPPFDRPLGVAETLAAFIQSAVGLAPESRYIEVNRAGERTSRTAAELHRRALDILPVLLDRVPPGESDVVLCFDSVLDFVPAAWACIYGGYSCLPWHMASGPGHDQDIRARLEAIGQRLDRPVLVTTEAIERTIADRTDSLFQITVCLDRDVSERSGADFRTAHAPSTVGASDAAFLIPTSGTTTGAKMAIVEHRCLLNRIVARRMRVPPRPTPYFVPFDGVTGTRIVTPESADRVYLQPARLAAQPLELLRLVEDFRLEAFGITSSVLARVLDAVESGKGRHDLSSLKEVGLGAEVIVPDIVRKVERFREMGATDLKVSFGYGMTEAGLICLRDNLDIADLATLAERGDPVSVGRCLAGWSMRIVDDEFRPLPDGTAGNIEIWSAYKLFSGYRNDPELNAESFAEDGWFRTGDIGFVRDGALTIVGRQKATIAVNARKISLESIEAPLRGMPGIRLSLVAAAAVRQQDSATDELAVFFVPDDDGKAAVDALCRRIVHEVGQHSGVPVKHLVPIAEGAVPLTATGKIRRDELVRLYRAGALAPHAPGRDDPARTTDRLTDTERWLAELWQKVLRLDFPRRPTASSISAAIRWHPRS